MNTVVALIIGALVGAGLTLAGVYLWVIKNVRPWG